MKYYNNKFNNKSMIFLKDIHKDQYFERKKNYALIYIYIYLFKFNIKLYL